MLEFRDPLESAYKLENKREICKTSKYQFRDTSTEAYLLQHILIACATN